MHIFLRHGVVKTNEILYNVEDSSMSDCWKFIEVRVPKN